MSKSKSSISKKLSRTLILLAFPICVLSLYAFYRQAHDLMCQKAVEHNNSILNTTIQHVVSYINAIETAARSSAWMLEENFEPDALQSISQRIVSLNNSVLSCTVSAEPDLFPQYGHYFSVYTVNEGDTILTVVEPDYDYFNKAWYKAPLEKGKPCWVDPFSDFNEGTINHHDAMASFSVPLRRNRQVVGVLSADFSFKRLEENILNTEHPYPNSYYMLIGEGGRYLVHPESSRLFKKTIFSETDSIEHPDVMELAHRMTVGLQGTMHVTFDKKMCHVSFAPVPGTSWSIALICPEDEILAEFNHLTLIMVGLFILALILIRLLTYQVVKQNIKPINQLLDMTNKIADGNYDEVIPLSKRKDAISKLQNSFAAMQQSIHQHMESIDHTAEEVKQQNAELQQAVAKTEEAVARKNVFTQNVLRQIRMPLNIIGGLTSVLRSRLATRDKNKTVSDDELKNITSTMKYNAVHLHRMMLMLYDSSDTGSDLSIYERNDNIACNALARECVDYTQNHFSNVEIHFQTKLPEEVTIVSNHLFLMRTVREVLYNAVKFSDGKNVTLRVTQTSTTVRFIIEDSGPGIPEESEDFIFQPFVKATDLSEGLGLGLPLSKRHATSLGGDLIYDANYHDGCRFIVEMPK
jgi:signal transduction histidine kinase